MPMIGARFYMQLDAMQMQTDMLENEVSKEMENGRLCRLLVKLGTINERSELVCSCVNSSGFEILNCTLLLLLDIITIQMQC